MTLIKKIEIFETGSMSVDLNYCITTKEQEDYYYKEINRVDKIFEQDKKPRVYLYDWAGSSLKQIDKYVKEMKK